MKVLDSYIQTYFSKYFQGTPCDHLPRDYDAEQELSRISKAELYLSSQSLESEILNDIGLKGNLSNGISYEIHNNIQKLRLYKYGNCIPLHTVDSLNPYKNIIAEFPQLQRRVKNFGLLGLLMERKQYSLDKALQYLNYLPDFIYWCPEMIILLSRKNISIFKWEDHSSVRMEYQRQFEVMFDGSESKKIYLPQICDKIYGNWLGCDYLENQFFNQGILEQELQGIILTDSLEIAGQHQDDLNRHGVTDIAWLSWYNNSPEIPELDWSLLKKYNIYYLLRQHSGRTRSETLNTTEKIIRQFTDMNRPLKILSYLEGDWANDKLHQHRHFPEIINGEDFFLRRSAPPIIAPVSGFTRLSDSYKPMAKVLLAPLISERTVSVIYGDEGATWLALFIADCIAYGKDLMRGWKFQNFAAVHYLVSDLATISPFLEKMPQFVSRINMSYTTANNYSALQKEYLIKEYVDGYEQFNPKLLVLDDFEFVPSPALLHYCLNRNWTIIIVDHNRKDSIYNTTPFRLKKVNLKKTIHDLKSITQLPKIESNTFLLDRPIKLNIFSRRKYFGINNTVKIISCVAGQSKLKAQVKINSLFIKPENFTIEIDLKTEQFNKIKEYRSPRIPQKKDRKKMQEQIKEHYDSQTKKFKLTGKQIARKLGITESLVKKLKMELGLSKPRFRYKIN